MKTYQNICETIGNTPIVKLNKIEKELDLKNNLYAKIEKFNPGGSIKDRVALEMIEEAKKNGKINKGTTIIEATSGNTGIGLAVICAYYDLKLIIVMPKGVTKERIKILEAYGAKVILTRKKDGVAGSIKKALRLKKIIKESYYIDQFSNFSNAKSHYDTTGNEILTDLEEKVDFIFIGMGSGGTITGVSKKIKEIKTTTKIIGVEPFNCSYYKNRKKGKYYIPGIGTTFIPKIVDMNNVDDIALVKDEEAKYYMQMLTKKEGIFVGYSSGAVLAAVVNYIKDKKIQNKNIVIIFPDGGERYISIQK